MVSANQINFHCLFDRIKRMSQPEFREEHENKCKQKIWFELGNFSILQLSNDETVAKCANYHI